MKKKSTKNYLILLLVLIITVFLAFYIRSWYITSKEYYSRNSVIKDIAREINSNEIGSYTIESQRFILYASSGADTEVKDFENKFKNLIQKIDGVDILYLNLDNVNIDSFNTTLKNNFAANEKIASKISNSNSVIYIFENGKIVGVLNHSNKYSSSNIKSFLEKWGY